jgi:hypothetical protein
MAATRFAENSKPLSVPVMALFHFPRSHRLNL